MVVHSSVAADFVCDSNASRCKMEIFNGAQPKGITRGFIRIACRLPGT